MVTLQLLLLASVAPVLRAIAARQLLLLASAVPLLLLASEAEPTRFHVRKLCVHARKPPRLDFGCGSHPRRPIEGIILTGFFFIFAVLRT